MTGSGGLPEDAVAGSGAGAAMPVRDARHAASSSAGIESMEGIAGEAPAEVAGVAGTHKGTGAAGATGAAKVTRPAGRVSGAAGMTGDAGATGTNGAARVAPTVAGLARACHPGPTAAVTTLVTALVAVAGWGPAGTALTALAVLTGQLSVGWCNDAVDAGRDAAAGRTSKPIVAGLVSARTVRVAAFAALAVCVPLSLACGVVAGATHLVAVAAAWAYNLWLKGTAASWVPYAAGFGAVPVFVTTGTPGHALPVSPPAWWAVLAAALLGCAAHLANVLPDIETDVATGVRGWPQRLGPARVRLVLPLPLLAASALLVVAPPGPAGPARWLGLAGVAACAAAGLLLARRVPVAPFAAAIGAAGIDVLLLAATPGVVTGG